MWTTSEDLAPRRRRLRPIHLLLLGSIAISWIMRPASAQQLPLRSPPTPPAQSTHQSTRDALRFLTQLSTRTRDRVLCGQNLGHANSDLRPLSAKLSGSGRRQENKEFALLGIDYGWKEIPTDLSQANRLLIAHWKRGGLVTLSMHPGNPWTGGGARDTRTGSVDDLLSPDHPAHRRWMGQLHRAATGLRQLKQAGVVVLWRPLHEMNGDWFWWSYGQSGTPCAPSDFVRLWRHMHGHLRNVYGLDNLLWVFAASARTSESIRRLKPFYPGQEFVDIVGLDYYADDLDGLNEHGSYDEILSFNKPFGLTEFGPLRQRDGTFDSRTLIQSIRRNYSKTCFFLCWHSWPGAKVALIDQHGWQDLLGDDWILTLDKMPTREPILTPPLGPALDYR